MVGKKTMEQSREDICGDEQLLLDLKKLAVYSMLLDYEKLLGLEEWEFELIFTKVRKVHGSVDYDLESRTGSIIINIRDKLPEIRMTLLHELCHPLLKLYIKPMKNLYYNLIERLLADHEEEFCRQLENLAKLTE